MKLEHKNRFMNIHTLIVGQVYDITLLGDEKFDFKGKVLSIDNTSVFVLDYPQEYKDIDLSWLTAINLKDGTWYDMAIQKGLDVDSLDEDIYIYDIIGDKLETVQGYEIVIHNQQ